MSRNLAGRRNHAMSAKTRFGVFSVLIFSILVSISGSFAQESKSSSKEVDPQAYVGTWQARFNDKVFQTIKLENSQGKLFGTVSRGNVGVNDQGELISAEAMEGTDPIIEAKAGSGVLHLTTKPKDKDESHQFEIKLIGTDTAEVRIVGIPETEKIKPWRLERVKTSK